MTFTQIKEVLARYDARLDKFGIVANQDRVHCQKCLEHVRWMCRELPPMMDAIWEAEMIDLTEVEKVHRWLGFIQGVLFSEGVFTIDEMREHNR